MPDSRTYIEPTQAAGAALFSRAETGAVVMLNLLRFRDWADYSDFPDLAPAAPIPGREAYRRYMLHTEPFLERSGGELVFLGDGGHFFIGPEDERWDLVMLVRQQSLQSFLAFATDPGYLRGIGHRTAALDDSRLLPIFNATGLSATAP